MKNLFDYIKEDVFDINRPIWSVGDTIIDGGTFEGIEKIPSLGDVMLIKRSESEIIINNEGLKVLLHMCNYYGTKNILIYDSEKKWVYPKQEYPIQIEANSDLDFKGINLICEQNVIIFHKKGKNTVKNLNIKPFTITQLEKKLNVVKNDDEFAVFLMLYDIDLINTNIDTGWTYIYADTPNSKTFHLNSKYVTICPKTKFSKEEQKDLWDTYMNNEYDLFFQKAGINIDNIKLKNRGEFIINIFKGFHIHEEDL